MFFKWSCLRFPHVGAPALAEVSKCGSVHYREPQDDKATPIGHFDSMEGSNIPIYSSIEHADDVDASEHANEAGASEHADEDDASGHPEAPGDKGFAKHFDELAAIGFARHENASLLQNAQRKMELLQDHAP